MTTPAPTPLHPLTFAERFWAQVRGPETDEVPEPLRSLVLVRHFLSSLDRLDATSPRKAAAALVAMLRQAELEGDLSYASPEQVRGEILDTRSVVFSLGVVLFERLTGRHPFGAENNRPRRIDRIRKGELGSGVNSFPTVAAGLRSVLVRAMSPFPEERWPDLRQMRELLASFISSESASPRLPGTESDVQPAEHTKVVRLATDFGRELMQVVAAHDRPPTARPVTEPPRGAGPRTSQRLAVPTTGVATVTGATAPARRPRQTTPRHGMIALRAVTAPPPVPTESSSDSVVTRIHEGRIDPLAETIVQSMPDQVDIARRIDDALREVSEPSIVVAATVPPPIPPPLPPRPTPAATARLHAAASVPPIAASSIPTAPAAAAPTVRFTPPAGLPSIAEQTPFVDLRPARSRTALIAVVSAAIGAVVAVTLFIQLGSAPPSSAAAAAIPAGAASAATPAGSAVADSPVAQPAPVADDVVPTPPAEPPPVVAPIATAESKIGESMVPCLGTGHRAPRVFGLSLLFRYGAVAKPYFAAGDALTSQERGCIAKRLRGMAVPGAPHSAVNEYKVRVDDAGVHVTQKASH